MRITITASGNWDGIAEYVHHVADQIGDGFLSGYEGGQGNAWSIDKVGE